MAKCTIISQHALTRFKSRVQMETLLRDQLKNSVPIGGQLGDAQMRLLPCGLVATVVTQADIDVVTTILTQEMAVANMQSKGIPFELPVEKKSENRRKSLEQLANEHVRSGMNRKKRNQDLRNHGYDPGGIDGETYRDLFNNSPVWRRDSIAANCEEQVS